ncbi:MAB_1171c family putative transporter [Kutzneria sp. NPDC052558]|uniref:MAB_1171c family putative transporter n=1 Tax=Kutzneria sp. NPDC052558 TaxID=3364121 RepID=UPI0037C5644B
MAEATPLDYWFIIIGSLECAAALYKLRDLHRATTPEGKARLRPICLCLGLVGIAFIVYSPSVAKAIDIGLGVPNLAPMLAYTLAALWAAAALALMLYWRLPVAAARQRMRWRTFAHVGVAATMVILFFAADTHDDHPSDFDAAYEHQPFIAASLLLFYLTILTTSGTVIYWSLHWSRQAAKRTAWALRLLALGLTSAVFFSVMKIVALVGGWFGVDLSYWSTVLAPLVGTAGMPVSMLGIVLPALSSRLGSLASRLRAAATDHVANLKAYRQLEPLWSALLPVDPRLIHRPRGLRQRSTLRIRLFWRIIEIRDWQWKLRPHIPPDATHIAARHCQEAGIAPELRQAVIEAVLIRAALAAQAQQVVHREEALLRNDIPSAVAHLALVTERERLAQVAGFFRRSTIVDRAFAELTAVPSR